MNNIHEIQKETKTERDRVSEWTRESLLPEKNLNRFNGKDACSLFTWFNLYICVYFIYFVIKACLNIYSLEWGTCLCFWQNKNKAEEQK